MKPISHLMLSLALILCTASCQKTCNCSEIWDSSKTYVKGDKVKYSNSCWEAVEQGRGIKPGPWMQNGNDIWEECQ